MRLILALKAFFRVLFVADFARQVELLLSADHNLPTTTANAGPPASTRPVSAVAPAAKVVRNDAISLLSALQREARFVDIVMEPIAGYSDAQIGAACRDVLRDCGTVLQRIFALQPEVNAEEGAVHETPAEINAARYRLTGNVSGDPPFQGRLVHHGWCATRCELPQWTGGQDAAMIVAPVELEIE